MLLMLVPVYKCIPRREVQKNSLISQNELAQNLNEIPETVIIDETPFENREINLTPEFQINFLDLIAHIWFFGNFTFMLAIVSSYALYIIRKRKNAVILTDNTMLNEVKKEMKIKRNIKIGLSTDTDSPMLVGIFFSVIYIPCREMPDGNMRMVFLHELTHYKRKDLFIKWMAVFVNALHWFNPLVYLLRANVCEACEVSCDMAVTKNMSDAEQKNYMKTILDLIE